MARTDAELVARWAARQDAAAFREVALRHAAMVHGVCRRVLKNAADAEDAAQECFIALARRGQEAGAFVGPWLHRVATNCALQRLRAETRRRERETRYAAERTPQAEARWEDIAEHVDEAVAQLPDELRLPLVMHFYDDRSHRAVARALGVPRRTVTYRIAKAVEAVRAALERKGAVVPAAVLASMLGRQLTAEAAPLALKVALAKVAIAGTGQPAAAATGSLLVKAVAALVLAAGAAGVGAVTLRDGPAQERPILATADAPDDPTDSTDGEVAPPAKRKTASLGDAAPLVEAVRSAARQGANGVYELGARMSRNAYDYIEGMRLPGLDIPAYDGKVSDDVPPAVRDTVARVHRRYWENFSRLSVLRYDLEQVFHGRAWRGDSGETSPADAPAVVDEWNIHAEWLVGNAFRANIRMRGTEDSVWPEWKEWAVESNDGWTELPKRKEIVNLTWPCGTFRALPDWCEQFVEVVRPGQPGYDARYDILIQACSRKDSGPWEAWHYFNRETGMLDRVEWRDPLYRGKYGADRIETTRYTLQNGIYFPVERISLIPGRDGRTVETCTNLTVTPK